MSKFFYGRLAAQNIRKNGKFYIPYLLTVIGTAASFYMMAAICSDPGVAELPGTEYVRSMMSVGMVVAGAFAAILLFYTNSFLIKRRQKELGLYNILGMSKGNIARLMCAESLYVLFVGVGGGIIFGITFHKLILLIMFKILRGGVPFGFFISFWGIKITAILFSAVILVTLLFNLSRVRLARPIELLHGSNTGEKEPKTKWILAVLGILFLGAGYYIALKVQSPVEALAFYFLAVSLVIAGTYCLFVAVSIAILKLLRKNKKFYYKTRNFIGVSGMLYRMKQNGVGLANICILSTMVMVMISGTLSLYIGSEESLNNRYPADVMVTAKYYPESGGYIDSGEVLNRLNKELTADGAVIEKSDSHMVLSFAAGFDGEGFTTDHLSNYISESLCNLVFITADEYAEYAGVSVPELSEGEVLVYTNGNKLPDDIFIDMGAPEININFHVKEHLNSFPPISDYIAYIADLVYFVVPDDVSLNKIYEAQRITYSEHPSSMMWEALIDLEDPYALSDSAREKISMIDWTGTGHWESLSFEYKAEGESDMYSMTGGFLFLGLFLGFLFIMATVLIIYYKQISEGYDDAGKYEIMRKVGLSKSDIRKSVNAQILTVFFLPVIVAAVHIAFDFRLVVKLLSMFALKNIQLILMCTLATLIVFVVVYGIVFLITSKAYYRIVSGGK